MTPLVNRDYLIGIWETNAELQQTFRKTLHQYFSLNNVWHGMAVNVTLPFQTHATIVPNGSRCI